MELDYNTFKGEFKEESCIKTHEFTKRETKIRFGTWRGRDVVLKYCYKELEALLHSKLPPHPNIVEFIAIVRRPGNVHATNKHKRNTRTYVLMEEGSVDLMTMCYGFDLQESLSTMIDIVKGLQHLHACGIVHHDMKMGNVLLTPSGYKICDLGASEFTNVHGHGSNDHRRRITGTRTYLAPEQAGDSLVPITNKIDIYAVGIVGRKLLSEDEPTTTNIESYLHIMTCCYSIDPGDRCTADELLKQLVVLQEKLEPLETL